MRKFARLPAPQAFQENATQWTEQWLANYRKKSSFTWYQKDGKNAREWALPVLKEMTQGHCSFCDGFPLDAQTNEPIEHFRPKDTDNESFATLAYKWDNLYYCCDNCNTTKGKKWEDGLIAADEHDYQFSNYFIYDFEIGQISPNPTASPPMQARAETTIRLYGLDDQSHRTRRRLELLKYGKTSHKIIDDWAYRDFLEPI